MTTDPLAYAMGYSVYYYYVNSYWLLGDAGGGELKLLAVDGVLPSDETIADGSYPLAGYNYLVLRAGEPEDAPARRLAEFMVSEAGQTCVAARASAPCPRAPRRTSSGSSRTGAWTPSFPLGLAMWFFPGMRPTPPSGPAVWSGAGRTAAGMS